MPVTLRLPFVALAISAVFVQSCRKADTGSSDSTAASTPSDAPEAFVVASAEPRPCTRVAAKASHARSLTDDQIRLLTSNGVCAYLIPEYHDEQRLSNGGTSYGSFVRAYAVDAVGVYDDHTDFHGGYHQVGVIFVDGNDIPGPYNALHLSAGFNCVYLTHEDTPDRWWAKVSPPVSGVCRSGVAAKIVTSAEQFSTNAADYPAVTRWVEGSHGGHSRVPMLGVRCGNAWCNIGPGSANNSTHAGEQGAGTTARWVVRGWYDEQKLSLPASPIPAPDGPTLSIVPHDQLGSKLDSDFLNNWVEVARVVVPSGATLPAKYGGTPPNTTGFHFRTGVNVISLRHNTGFPGDYWEVEVRNGAVFKRWRKVTPEPHAGWSIPGTARWKWSEQDEEIWVRCGVGCCTIQPE